MKEMRSHSNDSNASAPKGRATVYMVNGDRYLGEWKGNAKDGKGLYYSKKSGSIFQGEWKHDKRHGFGTLSVRNVRGEANGVNGKKRQDNKNDIGKLGSAVDELSNIFAQMDDSHGAAAGQNAVYLQGKLRKVYAGHWHQNLREGYGTSFEADGSTYEGEWKQNHKNGWGVMYYNDGSRYEGEWYLSKRHGQGMFIHINGNRYEGMWFNDLKEGPGKFIYKDQRRCYQGEWSMDLPKCGTLVDMPPAKPKPFQEQFIQKHPIPELKLKNPEDILKEEKSIIQQDRIKRLWPVPSHVSTAIEAESMVEKPVSADDQETVVTNNEGNEDEEENDEIYPYLVEGTRSVDSHFLHEKMQDFHRLETA